MSTPLALRAAAIIVAAAAWVVPSVTATASSAPPRSSKPVPGSTTAVPDHRTGITPTGTPTDPPQPAPVYRAPQSSSPVKWDGATVAITSDTRHGTTRSLVVRYVATVHGVCGLRDGETEPCPLPAAGKLTWQVLGAEAGLSWAYRSAPLARCSVTITLRRPVGGCAVDWGVYGDQTIAATYRSAPGRSITDEVTSTVRIVAPVDLGRMQYRLDGNAHIGDCTLATAADWVETTTGVTPPSAVVVADYWAAMTADGYGHYDIGLSMSQLWSYWRSGVPGSRASSRSQSGPWGPSSPMATRSSPAPTCLPISASMSSVAVSTYGSWSGTPTMGH